ncbi:dynamin family protein [Cohnella soli]|uniref:Dynamin family protein n=1 Tax=Cohnella soli TaxID=425005 RepID=A0ABW0HRI6_9BACL
MSHTESLAPEAKLPLSNELVSCMNALTTMSARTLEHGDPIQADKFAELSAKLAGGKLTVAFCGHFSAGKSTLVNAICGAQLLPSSPIPTSANVVTVSNGEPSASTVFKDAAGHIGDPRDIAVEDLHRYAADGEGVTSIRVTYPIPLLGDRMAIVDTPGVDSTDGAHRAATESALHLADVVFFVTDYNHVQSEVNFRFMRSLARWGKPTYLIVNMIDKHQEEQLSFAAFRDSLSQALANWDIAPAGTLFLSLREPSHPLSQWDELLRLMKDLQPLATPLMLASATRSARHLAEQFRETLHEQHSGERDRWLELLGDDGELEARAALRVKLEGELSETVEAEDMRRNRLRTELDKLLGSANLTPAETREKARETLAAMQPGFKVGWLGGAAKTEAERTARLERLADDFNRQVEANVTGHVKELLRKAAVDGGSVLAGEELEASLDALFRPVTAEWLKALVKPGASADGQVTLNYSAEISAELKAIYRKAAVSWAEEAAKGDEAERTANAERLKGELAKLTERDRAADELEKLEAEERGEESRLLALLPGAAEAGGLLALPKVGAVTSEALAAAEATASALAGHESGDTARTTKAVDTAPSEDHEMSAGENSESPAKAAGAPAGAAEKLAQAAELLTGVPALRTIADGLRAKAERFRNRSFTIALFGAFSAGKSSFANALVGAPALPVSPNPTTATINRIVAPTTDYPDGTAIVTMKTPEAFADDVRHSLKRIGIGKEKLEAAGDDVKRLLALKNAVSAGDLHPRGRPHLAFLHAAEEGWAAYGSKLGEKLVVGRDDYRRFAAEEQASCFVADIDLHVDSPLTRSGAVLVDTPGADSINARHTGVAFQYIKNADAVLFVTYYNHAFTEADREFLNQLGSVKDVFELDKMFFVINAADLATSEAELNDVKDHVSGQLLKHGIRKPRLFAVSSRDGLTAKLARSSEQLESSGIAAFEAAFKSFSHLELGGLALASANKELERVDKLLEGWLQSANEDAATREAKARKLAQQAEKWRVEGVKAVPPAAAQPLEQEIGEQLYHLRQRLKFRFKEHFQLAFHPSVLQDDGRDLKKLLQACGDDLKRSLGEDLLQELRAAGLRLEGTTHKLAVQALDALPGLADMAGEGFQPETPEKASLELPLPEPFSRGPSLDAKMLWASFRSPKHFFEKEGATALREQLNGMLFDALDEQLDTLRESWNAEAGQALRQAVESTAAAWSDQLSAFALSVSESLLRPGEETILSNLRDRWRNIIQ